MTIITSRPDLLPFAEPTRLGLPYHGLVRSGQLALPGGEFKEYAQPTGGDTILVQHPLHAAPDPDDNVEHVWQEYALLSGGNRQIGGQDLGDTKWLYCETPDEDHPSTHTWVVSHNLIASATARTLTYQVWLEKPFGLFTSPPITMTRRLIGSYTWVPKLYDGTEQDAATAIVPRTLFATHTKTGAKTLANVIIVAASRFQNFWYKTPLPWTGGSYPALSPLLGVHDVLRTSISGIGSLAEGEVGVGITAAVEVALSAPGMILTDEPLTNRTEGATYGKPVLYNQQVTIEDLGRNARVECDAEPDHAVTYKRRETYDPGWTAVGGGGPFSSWTYKSFWESTFAARIALFVDKDGAETPFEVSTEYESVTVSTGSAEGQATYGADYHWDENSVCSMWAPACCKSALLALIRYYASCPCTWTRIIDKTDTITWSITVFGKQHQYVWERVNVPFVGSAEGYCGGWTLSGEYTGPRPCGNVVGSLISPLAPDSVTYLGDPSAVQSTKMNGVDCGTQDATVFVTWPANNVAQSMAGNEGQIDAQLFPQYGAKQAESTVLGYGSVTLHPVTYQLVIDYDDYVCFV